MADREHTELSATELLDEVRHLLEEDTLFKDDRFVIFEVGLRHIHHIELRYSLWCGLYIDSLLTYPFRTTEAKLVSDLQDLLQSDFDDRATSLYKRGFVMGQFTDEATAPLEAWFYIPFDVLRKPGGIYSILKPDTDRVQRDGQHVPCRAPCTLSIMLAELVNNNEDGCHLRRSPHEICTQDRLIGHLDELKRLEEPIVEIGAVLILAPLPNDRLIICLRESYEYGPHEDEENYHYFWVQPPAREFMLFVCFNFDTHDWALYLDNQALDEMSNVEILPPTKQAQEPPSVICTPQYSNLVIAVESALAMEQHFKTVPPVGATRFEVIHALCKYIVDHFTYFDTTRAVILFYGDQHEWYENGSTEPKWKEKHNIPFEFSKIRVVKHSNLKMPPVRYMPQFGPNHRTPDFVEQHILQAALSDVENFKAERSATVDWPKALERVMLFINENMAWHHGSRVVVWIGQSPPHPYVELGTPPAPEITGYTSSISFDEQLQASHENNINHVAVFITSGAFQTLPPNVPEEAYAIWQCIGERHTFRLDASQENVNAFDQVLELIHEAAEYRAGLLVKLIRGAAPRMRQARWYHFWAMESNDENRELIFLREN